MVDSLMGRLDQCAHTLTAAGIPCAGYQMWVDEADLVHYWFDLQAHRTPLEDARVDAILVAYLGQA